MCHKELPPWSVCGQDWESAIVQALDIRLLLCVRCSSLVHMLQKCDGYFNHHIHVHVCVPQGLICEHLLLLAGVLCTCYFMYMCK